MSGEATVKQYMTGIVKQVSAFLTDMLSIEKPYINLRFLCGRFVYWIVDYAGPVEVGVQGVQLHTQYLAPLLLET